MAEEIREVEITAIAVVTLPANLPVNMKTVATIQLDPAIAALGMIQVPVDETWVVEDLYVTAAPTPDCIVEFVKNLTQSAYRSAPLSGCLLTNVARPIPTPFTYEGAAILTVVVQNLAAVGAAAVTVTIYFKLHKFTPF